MLVLPNQQPGLIESYGLTRAEVDREAWTIDPGGERLGGAAAVNRVLRELALPWRALAALYRVPGVAPLEGAAYRWVARHRGLFARWGDPPPY